MTETISWVATVATIVAAFMTASNLGSRVTGYGFAVFTIGALCWIAVGLLTDQPALLWTNVMLTALDIFGVWRWLGRQARVEEGARSATEASELTPGETLFPVSLLGRAPVKCGGRDVGRCIDAMAGSRSGRLDYLVVSEGGVAGVGERLRRLPWRHAHVDDETIAARLPADGFERLEELPRDQWPGR
ncbi:MAG TPA: PRC-barrel domain containing protein [Sphingomicrobium sp.]|nr:PRC-barrel domain containing protein [Sphingomicrobium sp.]